MSRRAPMNTPGKMALSYSRMSPGGQVWAESPVRHRWSTAAGTESDLCEGAAIYPAIYMPDPTSVSQDAQRFIIPRSIGMPIIEGSTIETRQGGFMQNPSVSGSASMVAGIAPGSTNAYRIPFTGSSNSGGFMNFYVYGVGGAVYPTWNKATHIRISGSFKATGLNYNSLAGHVDEFAFRGQWRTPNNNSFTYTLRYNGRYLNEYPGLWYLQVGWDGDSGVFPNKNYELPAFDSIVGHLNNVVYTLSMDLDTVAKTCTISINGVTTTVADPDLWPSKGQSAAWDNPLPLTTSWGLYSNMWFNNFVAGSGTLTVDQFRIETDVPWCPISAP